ncbi:flagella E [Halodesulfurarchaeum formicicum]|uniref:Flagella E n=1 Tax=Halodesulfurarchaeum formicicum TaxID=1873524 RepID=A0A1D8S5D5_9EURY|nr:FlaD/FlaE family flagellar protein [Halodesulfurarchaeum formicicum]AOW80559.1 flagella E [Halodesulfurarchaeum formicicum]APE95898.1 flagella E [Halodesulfurarchaeum formicicum]
MTDPPLQSEREARESRRESAPSVREEDIQALREDLAGADAGPAEFPEKRLKELLLLEGGADPADLERPYLERVPEQYAARLTVFEWLQFTLERAGSRQTLQALEYYGDIGWLGEGAAADLRDYVRVFEDGGTGDGGHSLQTADHLVSLVYIARLASMA